MGFKVSGKAAPEKVYADPLIVAVLIVTAVDPVELKVSVCVVALFTESLPKFRLEGLTLSVGVPAINCRANVLVMLLALAVSVTVVAVLTAVTVAVKLPLVAPAATVTVGGTVTAELLLARFTANPPVATAAFSVTAQLSVPAPVIEPLTQLSPVRTGTPVPLRLTAVDDPVDELLVSVNDPEAAPAAAGSNCTVSVAA